MKTKEGEWWEKAS